MPGSRWENGYIESFNARLRDELLKGALFYTLNEARVIIESWRRHYNTVRPRSCSAIAHLPRRSSFRQPTNWLAHHSTNIPTEPLGGPIIASAAFRVPSVRTKSEETPYAKKSIFHKSDFA
jgi:hypothetical protein